MGAHDVPIPLSWRLDSPAYGTHNLGAMPQYFPLELCLAIATIWAIFDSLRPTFKNHFGQ